MLSSLRMMKIENKKEKSRNHNLVKGISYIGVGFHFTSFDKWFQYWQSQVMKGTNYEF